MVGSDPGWTPLQAQEKGFPRLKLYEISRTVFIGQFQLLPDMLGQPYKMLPRCCPWQKWGLLQQTWPFDWKEGKTRKSNLLYDSSTKRQTLVPQLQHTTHVLWYGTTSGHDKLHPGIYSLALQDPCKSRSLTRRGIQDTRFSACCSSTSE